MPQWVGANGNFKKVHVFVSISKSVSICAMFGECEIFDIAHFVVVSLNHIDILFHQTNSARAFENRQIVSLLVLYQTTPHLAPVGSWWSLPLQPP